VGVYQYCRQVQITLLMKVSRLPSNNAAHSYPSVILQFGDLASEHCSVPWRTLSDRRRDTRSVSPDRDQTGRL
jgi:hypothetical protein